MNSKFCRNVQCPFFGKFSGKAVCRAQHPKKFVKHIDHCVQTLSCTDTGNGWHTELK